MAEKKLSHLHSEELADENVSSSAHKTTSKAKQQNSSSPLALEFITLTERPAAQKVNFSYTIRSHAMHSFLHAKKNPKPARSSTKHDPLAEVNLAAQLSGKFKLSTWSRKSSKKGNLKVKEEASDAESPDPDVGSNLSIDTSNLYGPLSISTNSPRAQRVLYHRQHSLVSSGASSLHSAHALDLADEELQDDAGFTLNAFAVNYDTWESFSFSDSALLHANLCLIAQHEDLLQGAEESLTTLYHKGQMMKLINQRLKNDPHNVTDASVTSVALLVILETINGTFEAASAHQVGLLKLIKLRGGLCSFEKNNVLLRALAWSDIVFSMRWGGSLTFPVLYPMDGSLAENLSSNFSLGMSQIVFPDFETNELLDTIQTISYVMEIPELNTGDKKFISDAVYNIQHKMLCIEDSQDDLYAYQDTRISPLSYAFTLAALLYLEVIICEHPFLSKVHGRLTSKLHNFLSESELSSYNLGSLPHRDILLWIMFVKAVTSSPVIQPENSTIYPVSKNLETEESNEEALRGRLRRIAWRGRICDYHFDRTWRKLPMNISSQ